MESLTDIAFQCPLSGGKAIFVATSIYMILKGITTFDDKEICNNKGISYRHSAKIALYLLQLMALWLICGIQAIPRNSSVLHNQVFIR
jgi:hypothetical protein